MIKVDAVIHKDSLQNQKEEEKGFIEGTNI